MNSVHFLLNSFAKLRSRQILDPRCIRFLLNKEGEKIRGWLFRSNEQSGPVHTGESLMLAIEGQADVTVTWQPMFRADMSGPQAARQRAAWFLNQRPKVTGGGLRGGPQRDLTWDMPADDFFLVRCGTYPRSGHRVPRHPTVDALSFVRDPRRFRVADGLRRHVLQAMNRPLPNGQWLTIRRIFADVHLCRPQSTAA